MDEERIRLRAYELWEREGRPEGRHEAHWDQARRELEADAAARNQGTGEPWSGEGAAGNPDALHPSGRNAGSLRPAAEAMGSVEGGGSTRQGAGTSGASEG